MMIAEINTVFPFATATAEPKGFSKKVQEVDAMETKEMTREVDSALHLLGSKQDIVFTNHRLYRNKEEWQLAVFDGHGKDTKRQNPSTGKFEPHNITLLLIQELIDCGEMDEILQMDIYGEEDPALIIQHKIADCCAKYDRDIVGGSTMSLVQITHDFATQQVTVNVLTVGDSPVTIFCNGEKVLEPAVHDHTNSAEVARLTGLYPNFSLTDGSSFEILDEHTICAAPSKYIKVNGRQLAMTQALGHMDYRNPYTAYRNDVKCREGIFTIRPEKHTMVFAETDELNIKVFSDGVGDIMNTKFDLDAELFKSANATEIAEFAKARWEQPWDAVNKEHYINTHDKSTVERHRQLFGNTADDISCASWIQKEL